MPHAQPEEYLGVDEDGFEFVYLEVIIYPLRTRDPDMQKRRED